MAVVRTTTFNSNAVGYAISTVPARVSAITIDCPPGGLSANSFVMIYDKASAPTIGTDTPAFVALVETVGTSGGPGRVKIVFPNGGRRFGTGVGLGVATAFNGATGIGATGPSSIDVFYETGN